MSELFCSNRMLTKFIKENSTHYEKKDKLKIKFIQRGVVFPLQISEINKFENNEYGGVCSENLYFIKESLTKRVTPPNFQCYFHDWFIGANPSARFENIEYIDEDVVFIGALPKHYGHFILEGLSRLWFYLKDENKIYKAVYISDDGEDKFLDFIKIFGIESENLIKITKPTKFKNIIIPEPSIQLHNYYHNEYKLTINQIKKSVIPIFNKKIYFSKEFKNNDRAIGEKSIVSLFFNNGFKIIHPENLTINETIAILSGADTFAATSGTNIHNSVFLKDQAEIICLNRSPHFHPIQIMIDRMRSLNSIYIDTFIFNLKSNWSTGPFLIFPTFHLLHFINSRKFHFQFFILYKNYPIILILYLKSFLILFKNNSINLIYNKCIGSKYAPIKLFALKARDILKKI